MKNPHNPQTAQAQQAQQAQHALRALCQQAGAQAQGWRPDATAAAGNPRRRWLQRGAIGGLGLCALAVVAAQFQSAPVAAAKPVPAAAAPWAAAAVPATPPVVAAPEQARLQDDEAHCTGAACALSTGSTIGQTALPAPAAPVKPPLTEAERQEAESQPDGSC